MKQIKYISSPDNEDYMRETIMSDETIVGVVGKNALTSDPQLIRMRRKLTSSLERQGKKAVKEEKNRMRLLSITLGEPGVK